MDQRDQVREILRDVLSLGPRADRLDTGSPLLGALPELDSMAVVSVIAALEDRFGFTVDDDEISRRKLRRGLLYCICPRSATK